MTGDKQSSGSEFVRASQSGVIVQAVTAESFNDMAISVGVGTIAGVAGGVAVTMIDSDTKALIGSDAQINRNPAGLTFSNTQSVYVNAANNLSGLTFAGALGAGTVGVAGAVDVAILRNDTLADVATGANLFAQNDVEVNSLSINNLQGYALGGSGGVVGLAASVSVWSIGAALEKNYSDDNRAGAGPGQTKNALEGTNGQRGDSDAARQAQAAGAQTVSYLNGFDDDAANPNNSSTKRVGQITALAAKETKDRTPMQAALQDEINATGPASGTTARISSGASVTANDAINVTSDAGLQFDQTAGALGVGFVGLGAGVAIGTLANNSTAHAGGTLIAGGGGITILSRNTENNNGQGLAGAAVFVALGASVVVINDASVAQSGITDGAKVSTLGSININTTDNRRITTKTGSLQVGALATGATFSRVNLRNDQARETQAFVGNITSLTSANLTVEALPTHTIEARTVGIAGGAIANTVNFAYVDAAPEAHATLGSGIITVRDQLRLNSSMNNSFKATGTGVSVAINAAGLMYADVNAGASDNVDEVVAGVVGAAQINTPNMTVNAFSNDVLVADSTSGAGGGTVLLGSLARTTSDMSTLITVGSGANIQAGTLGLYNEHRHDIDSYTSTMSLGVLTGKAALAENSNRGKANITIGAATIAADKLYFKANNDLVKNRANLAATPENQYRTNVDSATATIVGGEVQKSDTDIGTTSVPFQSTILFSPGARVSAIGTVTSPASFEVTALTNYDAVDRVNIAGFALAAGAAVGLAAIDVNTLANIKADNAILENKTGDINLGTRIRGENLPDSRLQFFDGLIGKAEARVRGTTNAVNRIDLNDSTIKARNVDIAAGLANTENSVTGNILDTQVSSSVMIVSILPSDIFNSVDASLREENTVNITGSTRIAALSDADISAVQGQGRTSEGVVSWPSRESPVARKAKIPRPLLI